MLISGLFAQSLFGYIFMPLAWSMGVQWSECHEVGILIGLKTIVNEFVAYAELAKKISAGTLSVKKLNLAKIDVPPRGYSGWIICVSYVHICFFLCFFPISISQFHIFYSNTELYLLFSLIENSG